MVRLRLCLVASLALYLGVCKVECGKIFFPGSSEVPEPAEAPPPSPEAVDETPHESRGLWESDLFFLQKLSGLFGSDRIDKRRTPARPSNLRPELLPPQMMFPNRRISVDGNGRPNVPGGVIALKQKRHPVRPAALTTPPRRQGSQGLRPPPHNSLILNSPHQPSPAFTLPHPITPVQQNTIVIAPSLQELPPRPPPRDALPQSSQNQPIAIRVPPLPPSPTVATINPVEPADQFPYQFVRPGSPHTSVNTRPSPPVQNTVQRVDPPKPAGPPRPIPPKPVKSKKPTFLGALQDLTGGFLGTTKRPPPLPQQLQQQHPRPAPQPQRVIIPPFNKEVTNKKSVVQNSEFNPSPQEGSILADAFQPVFVASPNMDDLGNDVMKPMHTISSRTSHTSSTTTSQPELFDFF